MKSIKGLEGRYSITKRGEIWSHHSKKFLKQKLDSKGAYLLIILCRQTKLVHRIVAQTFIPNPKKCPQVNHKNGMKTDNRVENLEWCTPRENTRHAFNNGFHEKGRFSRSRGSNHYAAILTEKDVKYIRKHHVKQAKHGSHSASALASRFNVSMPLIQKILRRVIWKHIN